MDRAIRAWMYKGVMISDQVGRLIAKEKGEECNCREWNYARFIDVAHGIPFSDWGGLIDDIDREMGILSSDFQEDLPDIRKLHALKEWAEGKKQHVTAVDPTDSMKG